MLLTFIREVADEPLVIDPASVDAETRENTWRLSAPPEERRTLSVPEVVRAFEECAALLRERVRAVGYVGPVTFYVWHDEQAGQLRCSTSSRPRDRLPFRARVDPDVPLPVVVAGFLADASPGWVSWDELHDLPDGAAGESAVEEHVVRVWTVGVGLAR